MVLKLIYALVLTIIPITELRVGLPLAISYATDKNIPFLLIFFLIVLLNILLIFFIFFFLDNLHKIFLKNKIYRKTFELYLKRLRKTTEKFNKRYDSLGFVALVLFVAIPLPGTGAWTGSLITWTLGLNRVKSIASIALGVIIVGIIIFIVSIGFINIF